MKLLPVPTDGHCILHSWKVGLQAAGTTVYSHMSLPANEITHNSSFYSDFIEGSLTEQLRELGDYNSIVVDMMLHALANATSTACEVISAYNNHIRTTEILPRAGNPVRGQIQVCKLGAHYDGIMHSDRDGNGSDLMNTITTVETGPKACLTDLHCMQDL